MNQDRRSRIVELVEQKNTLSNAEIIETFGVSIETVRRDLAYLEERGFLERVYGGCVRKRFMSVEDSYVNREKQNEEGKQAVGREAQNFIENGSAVFFGGGTTAMAVARQVDPNKGVIAFTNSLRTAIELSDKTKMVIMPGGEMRGEEFVLAGLITQANMNKFNIGTAIICTGGITEDMVTDFIAIEADLRSQIAENAEKVIVVADSSKIGVRAMCNVCETSSIDVLITDEKAPKDVLKKIEAKGVKVVVAKIK